MSEPSILRFENGDLDNNQTQTNRFEFVFSNLPNVTYTLYEVNLPGISLMNPESPTLFNRVNIISWNIIRVQLVNKFISTHFNTFILISKSP